MYMKRLVDFADSNGKLPSIGYSMKKYQWIATFNRNEEISLIQAGKNDQRMIPYISRAAGVKPILLTDKAEYVFQLEKEGATEKNKKRTEQCHEAYMNLLKECSEETDSESIKRVIQTLKKRQWVLPEEMKAGDIILIRLDIDAFPHEEQSVKNFWAQKVTPEADEEQNKMCIVCGKIAPAVERHSMEFLIGANRTKLISANKSAYLSYGLKASEVAPTCFTCEQKYGQALSYLLQKYTNPDLKGGPHTFTAGGVTYVYWTCHKNDEMSGIMSWLSDPDPDAVRRVLMSPFTGIKSDAADFYLLALTANKARLVVRDYTEKPYWKVKEQLKEFFDSQDVGGKKLYSVYSLAASMYRDANKEMQKYAIAEWVDWAINGRKLSVRIVSHILKRIQASGEMNVLQAASIKSWLISQKREDWNVHIDETKMSKAYLCGRLFAVLEKIQVEAIHSNETIAARFFASASTVPKSIFGMLIRNSQVYLSKIGKENKAFEVNYSKKIQSIIEHLPDFPKVLSPHGQAEFALGYYHQKQDFYKPKKETEGEVGE